MSCCSSASSSCSSSSGCCNTVARVVGDDADSGCSEDVVPIGFLAEGFILPPHLEMKRDDIKGRGLFFKGGENDSLSTSTSSSSSSAAHLIRAGQVLFREKPRVNFQFTRNTQRAFTCFHCARFIGNLSKQMKFLTGSTVTHDVNQEQNQQEKKELLVGSLASHHIDSLYYHFKHRINNTHAHTAHR